VPRQGVGRSTANRKQLPHIGSTLEFVFTLLFGLEARAGQEEGIDRHVGPRNPR
jgi:hypothetical protein